MIDNPPDWPRCSWWPEPKRHQSPLKIGEKIQAPSAPFDTQTKGQIKSQVGISN
jgi:hypothetical protein